MKIIGGHTETSDPGDIPGYITVVQLPDTSIEVVVRNGIGIGIPGQMSTFRMSLAEFKTFAQQCYYNMES